MLGALLKERRTSDASRRMAAGDGRASRHPSRRSASLRVAEFLRIEVRGGQQIDFMESIHLPDGGASRAAPRPVSSSCSRFLPSSGPWRERFRLASNGPAPFDSSLMPTDHSNYMWTFHTHVNRLTRNPGRADMRTASRRRRRRMRFEGENGVAGARLSRGWRMRLRGQAAVRRPHRGQASPPPWSR
jgi:hypothetical protein